MDGWIERKIDRKMHTNSEDDGPITWLWLNDVECVSPFSWAKRCQVEGRASRGSKRQNTQPRSPFDDVLHCIRFLVCSGSEQDLVEHVNAPHLNQNNQRC